MSQHKCTHQTRQCLSVCDPVWSSAAAAHICNEGLFELLGYSDDFLFHQVVLFCFLLRELPLTGCFYAAFKVRQITFAPPYSGAQFESQQVTLILSTELLP